MIRAFAGGTLVAMLCAGSVQSARAGVTGSVGLSLAPIIGKHVEGDGTVSLAPVPIPIAQASVRSGRFELFAESLPGSPAIAERVTPGSTLSTHLTFFDAVARVYASGSRFWAGAGEVVYNQTSNYENIDIIRDGDITLNLSTAATDASRVAGGRYEAGAGFGRDARRIQLSVDLMPSLTGLVRETGSGRDAYALSAAERGAQVESKLAISDTHPAFSFQYGVRYVNYSTKFSQTGRLSDHNVGFLPYATFALNLGR